eukprot:TRINITY_DN4159_c0_g1_i1.p1 TRINITY_DN4159_c0_g1~~TRINITY_DN4159_c0_g1_i1.p1  ORF type:complete len:277 (+),score=50.67 TRINITY_DN4159_c0_g1_i1:1397-2227(+)
MTPEQLKSLQMRLENNGRPNEGRPERGAALGLTIAQTLCKAIGAKGLQFESTSDAGTRVYFAFPVRMSGRTLSTVVEVEPSPGSLVIEIPEERPLLLNSLTLIPNDSPKDECHCRRALVVDDNDYNIMVLSRKLLRRGFEVETAANGKEAIATVKQICTDESKKCDSPDCMILRVIFMDVDMPIMDGLQATQGIKQLADENIIPPVPIVGCSAFDSKKDIKDGLEVGMSQYLSKPVLDAKLDDILRKLGFEITLRNLTIFDRQSEPNSPLKPPSET